MDEKKKQIALDITTQIVVAKMSNSSISVVGDCGIKVGDFFSEIYKKIAQIVETN